MKTIDAIATECASELRKQGWAGDGAAYEIATYYGDREYAEGEMGRPLSADEVGALQSAIRASLDAQG